MQTPPQQITCGTVRNLLHRRFAVAVAVATELGGAAAAGDRSRSCSFPEPRVVRSASILTATSLLPA